MVTQVRIAFNVRTNGLSEEDDQDLRRILGILRLRGGGDGTLRFDPDTSPEAGAVEEFIARILQCGHNTPYFCQACAKLAAAARAELAARGEERVVEVTRDADGHRRIDGVLWRSMWVSFADPNAEALGMATPGRYTILGPHPDDPEPVEKVRPWRVKRPFVICPRCLSVNHRMNRNCKDCKAPFALSRPLEDHDEA